MFRRKKVAETAHSDPLECTPIALAPRRERATIKGKVVRMQSRPAQGMPTMVVSITDDTGTALATWTGRRNIGGVTLGRTIALTGVGADVNGILTFVNPEYTLLR